MSDDTNAPAPWLESDDEFEGVGAHRDNPRYTPVDEPGFDPVTGLSLASEPKASKPANTPPPKKKGSAK